MSSLYGNGGLIPARIGNSWLALRLGLLPLLFFSSLASADLTGISFEIGHYDSDWEFEDDTREAQIDQISFHLEERIESGLAFGFGIGYFDMRVVADSNSAAETLKFDGQFIDIYLRLPLQLSESISLHTAFSIGYNNGSESGGSDDDDVTIDSEDEADIDWTEVTFELGLGLRFGNFRVLPYAAFHDIDGDISGNGTDVFEMEDEMVQGLRLDYFVEDTAFVRFELVSGGSQGGYLIFVRRY